MHGLGEGSQWNSESAPGREKNKSYHFVIPSGISFRRNSTNLRNNIEMKN